MLSEKYCQHLEKSISDSKKQIRKLRSYNFTMSFLVIVGWGLFFISQAHQAMQ